MNTTQIVSLLLGSAAIGALVSSCVTLIGQWRERISRRQELLISKSVELAMAETNKAMALAKDIQEDLTLPPHIVIVEDYYQSLIELLEHGKLSEAQKKAHGGPPQEAHFTKAASAPK